MESSPLPALPADPVPPPPASRQASEDRGFADALRAAHGDDAEPDRKPASDRREASRPHRNDHAARRHATRHHDDAGQDAAATAAAAPVAPVAVAATDSGAGTKSTAGTTAGDTPVVPPPADAAATPADISVASDATATATPNETTDKTAAPPSGASADFAAAVRDGDHVTAATTDAASKSDSKSDGDTKKTNGASHADEPAPESARTDDKAPGETTAIPAMPAVVAQPTAAQPAAPVAGNVATTTAEIAAADVQAAAGPARPAAASAPAPVKAKADGKPDKPAATNDAADNNRDGKVEAGQSIKAGQEDDAADGKTSDRSAKKDDAAKDKSAAPTDVGGLSKPDGGTTAASGRPADATPAPQPVDGTSIQSTAPVHQAAPAPGAATAPASGFMPDLRAQAQLQTQQTQPFTADAAPRLPAPPADQVAVEIGRAVQQGHDRFSLELRPGDLGRISVDLQLGSDQRVVAVIHADRHDTLQLLQKDSHTLQRALQDAGLQTDSGSLSFNLRGEGGGSQRSFADLAGNARPIALRVPVAAAEAAAQLVRPWRIGDTGIDIRV